MTRADAAPPGALEEPPDPPDTLRFAGVYAFVGSGCLLVLELVAGRILAPAIGVSLYTWTSIIGVVLAGISLGNWLGGRIADRRPGRGPLSAVYLFSALASVLIVVLARDIDRVNAPSSWPAILQVIWLTTLMFFVPATLLGMATPMLVKLSLRSLGSTGRVVGRIQAAATLGSIVGTFATGFFLISWFGTRALVVGVAGALIVLGVLTTPKWTTRSGINVLLVIAFVAGLALTSTTPCLRESNYFCIRVLPGDHPRQRILALDLLIHGYVDLDDPAKPIYSYELLYDEMIRAAFPNRRDLDSFSIGGGTYTFPRYMEARSDGEVVVAEIDPAVTAVAKDYLALEPGPRMSIHHDDARRVLAGLPAAPKFEVIAGDAFNDAAVPFHLTTDEFNRLVAEHLAPDGLYLVNVVDAVDYDFLRSYMHTLERTFPYVRLMALEDHWPPSGARDAFVVVAGRHEIPRTLSMISDSDLATFRARRDSVVLTDDHVPVDQLLAPVFRQRLER